MQNTSEKMQPQELIEIATKHLISAANKLDVINNRTPHTYALQATALDIRLSLELLQSLKPNQSNGRGVMI